MGETPRNIDYNQSANYVKDVALGLWLFVVALMLITGSALHLLYVFKILFLVRFSHTLFLIGQHTLHNFHLLLTAVRVTDYSIMYGGPKMGGPYFHMTPGETRIYNNCIACQTLSSGLQCLFLMVVVLCR